MNNMIQHHNSYLDAARDARADVIKQILKGTFAPLHAVVRTENFEAILAAAYTAVGVLAVMGS